MNSSLIKQIKDNWDSIAKPLDSMGKFETLICQIGAILGTDQFTLEKKAMLVFCSDNGVVEEGVSQSGQKVTAAVTEKMGRCETSIGRMAKAVGADVLTVDVGVNSDQVFAGVRNEKIAKGTKNFAKEPAMSEDQMKQAIAVGEQLVLELKEQGYAMVGLGEMGIGNTTTSSAIAAALLDVDVQEVTGRGAGLGDAGLARKQQVIREALNTYHLKKADPLTVLQTVGGFDIAAMAGVCLGAAEYDMPVVLDGVISQVAALVASKTNTEVLEYLIPSHAGKEPASRLVLEALGLDAVIYGDMALGEGCGATMMFSLLDMAMVVYSQKYLFDDLAMEPYRRFLL